MTDAAAKRANYFGGAFCRTDPAAGAATARGGSRLVSLAAEWVEAMAGALAEQGGEAAAEVGYAVGKEWGGDFADWLAGELQQFHDADPLDGPVAGFAAHLQEAFANLGWGRLSLDMRRFRTGVLIADVEDGPFTEIDGVLPGLLAGLFARLTGEDLGAAVAAGRFLISHSGRIAHTRQNADPSNFDQVLGVLEESRA